MKYLTLLLALCFIGCGEGTTVVCPDPVINETEVIREIEIPVEKHFEPIEVVGTIGWLLRPNWMYYDDVNGIQTQYLKKIYCELASPLDGSSHKRKITITLLKDTIALQNPGHQFVGKWSINTIILTEFIAPGDYRGYIQDVPTKK